jgi:SnoaL-like polyketide cyclase
MPTTTDSTRRTAHLLELMTKGDDLFNARDWQALDDVHHPEMIAHIPGSAEPIYGREAHGAAMQQLVRMFPDIRVHTPYPIQFGDGDSMLNSVVRNYPEDDHLGAWAPFGERALGLV